MSNPTRTATRSKRQSPAEQLGESSLINESGQQSVQLTIPMESAFHLKSAFSDVMTQAGMLLINAFMNDEVDRLAGPRYAHDDGHAASRHGVAEGHVIIGGKKVAIERPRVRADGHEVGLTTYHLFSDPTALSESTYRNLMLGISTRDYRASVEQFGDGYGIEKSSVSRHFVEASAEELRALTERPLGEDSCAAIMIDGVHFAGTVFIVALGIAETGQKRILGLWSGDTEHAEVVGALLDDMIARGLDEKRRYLFVIDGSKALSKAIKSRFGQDACIQRCRVHKKRNILSHLPKQHHTGAAMRLNAAWGCVDYQEARKELERAHAFLEGINTHAARSLEEAFEETLTVQRIEVPAPLQRILATTNMIENLFSAVRKRTRNVKRWRNSSTATKKKRDMRQRWAAATLIESEKKFRRVTHYQHLTTVIASLSKLDQQVKTA